MVVKPQSHKSTIYKIIGCHYQQEVITFIERSEKFETLRRHYTLLLHKNNIETELLKLSSVIRKNQVVCLIEERQEVANCKDDKDTLLNFLEAHLRLGSIKVVSYKRKRASSAQSQKEVYSINLVFQESLSLLESKNKIENGTGNIFLVTNQESPPGAIEKISLLNLDDPQQYFSSLTKVLKSIWPHWDIKGVVSEVDNHRQNGTESRIKSTSLGCLITWFSTYRFVVRHRFFVGIFLALIIISGISLKMNKVVLVGNSRTDQFVRSELPLPTEDAFLERPELLKEITELHPLDRTAKALIQESFSPYY